MTDSLRFDAVAADFLPGLAFLAVVLVLTFSTMLRKSRTDRARPLFPLSLLLTLLLWAINPCFAIGLVIILGVMFWRFRLFKTYRLVEPGDRIAWAMAGFALLTVLASVPLLWRPHLNYDVLSYHLELAHLRLGTTGPLTHFYYNLLPDLGYWLYIPFLSDRATTFDDPGVRLLLLSAWVSSALLCGRIAGQLGARPRLRWATVLFFLWHPMGWIALHNAHNDLLVLMFGLAATSEMLRLVNRPSARAAITVGVMSGAACAVKFSAVGILAIPVLLGLIAGLWGKGGPRHVIRHWKPLASYVASAYAIFAFFTYTGRLISSRVLFPFVGESDVWTAEQATFVVDQHQPLGLVDTAYWTGLFQKLHIFDYSIPYTGISVIYLFALVAAVLHAKTRLLVFIAALGYGAWRTVGIAPDRFALPIVALVVIAGIMVLQALRLQPTLRRATVAILALIFAVNLYATSVYVQSAWMPELWERNAAIPENLLAEARQAEDRTLVFFDARSRWFPAGQITHTVWDSPPWAAQLRASEDLAEFLASFDNVDQVIVNERELARLVAFYGDAEVDWVANPPGVFGDQVTYRTVLESYPPYRFAGFESRDFEILEEFLALSRAQASLVYPQGGQAALWLSPLPRIQNP